jgi:hypothetical protein
MTTSIGSSPGGDRERADAGKAGIGGRSGKLNKDGTFSA